MSGCVNDAAKPSNSGGFPVEPARPPLAAASPGGEGVRTRHRTRERGFTFIEVMTTVLIMGTLAALAAFSMQRYRPRANLANSAAEIDALLNYARQNALATGNDTVVMIFPNYANPLGGTGRVIVYEDPTFSFFNAASATNFGSYDPAAPTVPPAPASDSFETLDLPRGSSFSGGTLPITAAPPPYGTVPLGACSFCAADGNGAVVFDARGTARFYSGNGAPLPVAGGMLALTSDGIEGYRMLVITPAAGAVKAFNRG
jgi:prepilin-type N-terminal cleavage/methylation domain-containing protein